MGNGKIDKLKLSRLLRSGKSGKACAIVFGVTEGAISQARKELNISVVKSVALENAHHVVDQNLNAVDQLQKINSYANELLDLLMKWNRGDETALQVLESQVKKVRVWGKEEEIMGYKFKDPRELALRVMAEIRGQLSLQLEIFKTLYDLEAVADFQREVLTAIGEADKSVRDRIVQRLKEGKALRGSVSIA
jgi:hypothetical protein